LGGEELSLEIDPIVHSETEATALAKGNNVIGGGAVVVGLPELRDVNLFHFKEVGDFGERGLPVGFAPSFLLLNKAVVFCLLVQHGFFDFYI
jgi:hypothetical protein